MKYLQAGLVSLALATSVAAHAVSRESTGLSSRQSKFVTTNGTMFNIDGVTKYYAGTNSYWISFLTNNADVDFTLDQLAQSGLKILRIWGFNDVTEVPGDGTVYFQHLRADGGSTINTGANGLQRLDYVVRGAEQRGIKLIINFVNNWDDYGGMAAYVRAFGGSKNAWYTNAAAQAQYRAYIRAVVSRFVDSPAILAWELANEPRCTLCSTSVITKWAAETSAYVKSLDPNHLVTLGDEGFGLQGDISHPYWFTEGLDFKANLAIESLDFGTFHLYPSHWFTSFDWGNGWVKSHAAACKAAGKPCLFEEYGAPRDHCALQRPWQVTSVSSEGIAADLFWQLGTTLSTGKTHDDTFTIYVGDSDWKCLVTDHVAAIENHGTMRHWSPGDERLELRTKEETLRIAGKHRAADSPKQPTQNTCLRLFERALTFIMEAMATLSLVCNVMTVIDFSITFIDIYRRLKSGTAPEPRIASDAAHLSSLVSDLRRNIDEFATVRRPSSASKAPLSTDAHQQQARDRLESIACDLLRDTSVVREIFAHMAQKASSGGRLGRLAVAAEFRFRHESKISALEKRIQGSRAILDTEFLSRICTTSQASAARSEQAYSALNTGLQLFIARWAEGNRDMSKLISSEAEATRKHIILATEDIKGHVTSTVEADMSEREIKERRERLLQTLWFPEMNARENSVEIAPEETVRWIFDDSFDSDGSLDGAYTEEFWEAPRRPDCEFHDWLESDDPIYWICGKAGSGKSTLMKFLIREPLTLEFLRRRTPSVHIGRFFSIEACSSPLQRRISGCLRTLLHQIFEYDPAVLENAVKSHPELATKRSEHDWSVEELQRVLFEVVEASNATYCLFLDALDEIEPSQQQATVELAKSLGRLSRVKVCVSSRPEPVFQRTLGRYPTLKMQDLTGPAIHAYVRRVLAEHQETLEEPHSYFITTISGKADGVFLWAVLATHSLVRGISNGDDWDTLRKRTEDLPSDLYQLYQHMWSRGNADRKLYREDAARIFWVMLYTPSIEACTDSLIYTVAASSDASAVELEACLQRQIESQEVAAISQKYETWVAARTAGLVETKTESAEDGRGTFYYKGVQFIHRSVQEFLLGTKEGYEILRHDVRTTLGKRCMFYKALVLWYCIQVVTTTESNPTKPYEVLDPRGINRYGATDALVLAGCIALYPEYNATIEVELISECKRIVQLHGRTFLPDSSIFTAAAIRGNVAYMAHTRDSVYGLLPEETKNLILYRCADWSPSRSWGARTWSLMGDWFPVLGAPADYYSDRGRLIEHLQDMAWGRSMASIRWLLQAGSDPYAMQPYRFSPDRFDGYHSTAYLQFLYHASDYISTYIHPLGNRLTLKKRLQERIAKVQESIEEFPDNSDYMRVTKILVAICFGPDLSRFDWYWLDAPDIEQSQKRDCRKWIFIFAVDARWLLSDPEKHRKALNDSETQPVTPQSRQGCFRLLQLQSPLINPPSRQADEFDKEKVQSLETATSESLLSTWLQTRANVQKIREAARQFLEASFSDTLRSLRAPEREIT
ncbi:hypothetical protein DL771_010220 [Monosporascus sp. 5C6A]|nr:hypothetical protein DL771_010220 [Monosporascus sp. 5C6A]